MMTDFFMPFFMRFSFSLVCRYIQERRERLFCVHEKV